MLNGKLKEVPEVCHDEIRRESSDKQKGLGLRYWVLVQIVRFVLRLFNDPPVCKI